MDLNGALDSHRRSGAIATMMVLPAPLGRDNAVYCDGLMQIGAIAKSPPQFAGSMDTWTARGFACVQIIEPEFLDLLPPIGPSDILEAYGHAIKHGMKLNSFIHDGFWHDLGSPAQLFQAHREVLELPEATAKKLLDELGVFAFAQAEGNDCLFVPSGSVWNSPGGKIEIIGPALLSRFNSESLTDWEKRLTSPVSMGPMVAAEAGFSVTDSCSIANAIIFSSAKLSRAVTTQTGHMATIHDHNHVIKIHQT
jgi:NDP-sugar pyrophosphorylase family protein